MRLPAFLRRSSGDVDTLTWTDGDDHAAAEMLDRYAADSLSPSDETLARMGGAVRAAFVESTANRASGLTVEAAGGGSIASRLTISKGRRRAFASICAVAILTLSSVGFAAAQSNPGQPFYRVRLNLEGMNLPFAVQGDQLGANLARADARLAEVGRAAAVQDWSAAADAAGAYREVILSTTLPADPAAKAAALQRLDEQLARLEQLRGTSRAPETAALDKGIAALCALLGIAVPTPTPAPATAVAPGGDRGVPPPVESTHRPPDGRSPDQFDGHATPTPFDRDGGPGHTDAPRRRH